jgi:hypothetical protein
MRTNEDYARWLARHLQAFDAPVDLVGHGHWLDA